MAYFNPQTGRIELSHEDREALFRPQTPYFISHFWDWISAGKLKEDLDLPKVPHVNILK